MKRFFSIRTKSQPAKDGEKQSRLSLFIARRHRTLADYLNKNTASWSRKKVLIVFGLFFVVSASLNLFVAIKGLSDEGQTAVPVGREAAIVSDTAIRQQLFSGDSAR